MTDHRSCICAGGCGCLQQSPLEVQINLACNSAEGIPCCFLLLTATHSLLMYISRIQARAHMLPSAGFSTCDLQACMERLVRLHQYAEAAEGFESLAPLIFIKEKYAQSCWLKASTQSIPADAAVRAGPDQGVDVAAAQACQQQSGVEDCADGVEPMQM